MQTHEDAQFPRAHTLLQLVRRPARRERRYRVDRSSDWDRVVFLLSGDWVVPLLPALGLFLDDRSQRKVHEATRHLTKKIVGESGNYWNANFSETRKASTKTDLIAALRENGLTDAHVTEILAFGEALVGNPPPEGGGNASIWIFSSLLQQLAATRSADHLPVGITRKTQEAVRNVTAAVQNLNEQLGVERALLESVTPWDDYLRKVTPGLPNYLTTWLMERAKFEILPMVWTRLRDKLNRDELAALRQWCIQEAAELIDPGTDLVVPRYCVE